jgi:catechol-2,3-dioxygenase
MVQRSAMSRLHHVALGAQDVERVAAFYRDHLALAECARHHHEDGTLRSIWLDMGAAILMIEKTTEPPRRCDIGAGPFLLAFRVVEADRARVEASLASAGVAVESRTAFTSYFRDPEGNRVAISHYPLPA